jgi:hypothetical protein
MGLTIRLAAGAAAVVVATVVAINLSQSRGVAGPSQAASPIPSPSATPGSLIVGTLPAVLNAGTYLAADPFLARVTFTVPAGWEGHIGGPYAVYLDRSSGQGGIGMKIFDKVYADPCHYQGLLNPQPGPSVDNLAAALAKLPGLVATTPTDVTFGGYSGKQLTLTAPASFAGCTLAPDGNYRIWELPLGATNDMSPGERDRIWILDVNGQRLVIVAPETPGLTAADKAEVQAVLDSIQIAPRT